MSDQLQIKFNDTGFTARQYVILDYLMLTSKGKGNAITGEELSKILCISYYRIRRSISHLVNDHGCLIASCTSGYFIPVTPEEIDEATRSLRHRGISILVRASKLQQTSLEDIFHQARLEYKGGLNVTTVHD